LFNIFEALATLRKDVRFLYIHFLIIFFFFFVLLSVLLDFAYFSKVSFHCWAHVNVWTRIIL